MKALKRCFQAQFHPIFASKITKLPGMSAFPDGYHFYLLPEVDSTNLHAMQKVHAGMAGHGDVFFTHYQTAGKGQRGRNWIAEPGDGLLLSLVLDCSKLATSQSFRLSATIALGVHDFLNSLVNEGVAIKWPNDLFMNDRKAGGILIENLLQGGVWKWAVIGIGLNINQTFFDDSLKNGISVRMVTQKTYDCAALARVLCGYIENRWNQLLAGNWSQLHASYNERLFGRGATVKLKQGSRVMLCQIKEVNERGSLLVADNDAMSFEHGDVEWLF